MRIVRHCLLLVLLLQALPLHAQYFPYGKNKVQYAAQDWLYIQSRHFDIYYYTGGYYLANFTAKAAEDAYQQLSQLFQYDVSKRIPLIVYQGHNDFAVTNVANLPSSAEGIGGVTELYKNRIALPFTGDYRNYRHVLHHELVHAVLNDMFYGGTIQSILRNNISLRIPLWFSEGLAEYAAMKWDSESDMYVREAVLEHHLEDIEQLYGYFAYRGGQGVWDYIAAQYGRQKIGEILQKMQVERSVHRAIQQATGLTLSELSERWHQTLREVYYPEVAAREDLDNIGRAILTRERAGLFNVNPALSPKGDKIAYLSSKTGRYDVYIANASDGTIIKKLIEGQANPQFESLRILTPGLSWSPDGNHIAIATKSGPADAIAVVSVDRGETTLYRIPQVDQIAAVAWSPLGDKLAFEATTDAQSDIFVLDMTTRMSVNHTGDIFSDHEPAWSPDGQSIVFHSDRGEHLQLGQHTPDNFDMHAHGYGQFDLYMMHMDTPHGKKAERLTDNETWDEKNARFGHNPHRLLFLSDRNGIFNLYEKDLLSSEERPLTNVVMGIHQMALSGDGQRAALVSLQEGALSIYTLQTPFERDLGPAALLPNVWAQRVTHDSTTSSPALMLASADLRQSNPFLRNATHGPSSNTLSSFAERYDDLRQEDDTTSIGLLRVDFRNATDDPRLRGLPLREDDNLAPLDLSLTDSTDKGSDYKPKKYRLRFSPDLVYGTAIFDALYGVQGITQIMFSDILGNHQIFLATNLLIDLRNSDYLVSYRYLPKRTDWYGSVYHSSRLLLDTNLQIYRYRWYGALMSASYPLNKFLRLDMALSVVGVSQADVTDPGFSSTRRTLFYPRITFTTDVTTPGFLHPVAGQRFAFSVAGSPFSLDGEQTRFASLLGDARFYVSFGRGPYTLTSRISGGASIGPDPQLFYSSGVQNWINRHVDSNNGFPISGVDDFVFATPVLPLRGYEINTRNGSYFGLINAEFRFPLTASFLPKAIPFIPLYLLQGTAFVDAGAIWGGRGADRRLNFFRRNAVQKRVLDDILLGAGLGLRGILLGYPIRLDYAWPFDGRHFGQGALYLSVGVDF